MVNRTVYDICLDLYLQKLFPFAFLLVCCRLCVTHQSLVAMFIFLRPTAGEKAGVTTCLAPAKHSGTGRCDSRCGKHVRLRNTLKIRCYNRCKK